jgi:sensor histidine kinase YesM
VAGFFFYYQGNNILDNARRHTSKYIQKKWTYQRSFAFMALARLIITSGIPVAFFYISAYNYEQNISIRYRQLQYANELINKLDSTDLSKVNSNTNFEKGYYGDSVWVRHISIDTIGPKLVHSEEDSITSKILDLFRINFTDLAIKEDKFSAAHAADSSFGYNPLLKDACKKDSATKTYVKLNMPGKYLAIESAGLNYKLPSIFSRSWFNGLLFWILFLLALCIFYFIVHNIISKLFCLNLPNLSLCNALDARIIRNPKINTYFLLLACQGPANCQGSSKK